MSQGADIVSSGDTNGQSDCFAAYVPEWTTERASTSSTDTELQYGGSYARIDDGGTQFVFTASDDDVMTPYTVNGLSQVYVRDLDTWSLERASLNGGIPPASAGAYGTDISGDGSRVALQSDDDGFYSGDNDAIRNLYVRVRGGSPVTKLVTPSTLNGNSSGLLLSESGMTGVFLTDASNITTDTNGTRDVVLWKDGVGLTVLSAVNGYAGNGLSGDDGYAIDGSGNVVAFGSRASNLVAGDTNGKADVFVWREGSGLERMAVGAGDTLGNGHSRLMALSNDGRFVLYSTEATNAPSGTGVYLRDSQAVAPRYVAASATHGALGDGGAFVVISTVEVLLAGDSNSVADVYLARADFAAPTTTASVESSYNAGGGPIISAVDANAVTVYWRYNGEATQSAPAPATAVRSEAGTSTLVYWGVDSEGNTEKPKSAQVVVGDTRAPETEAVGAQASYDGTASISLVATDKAIGTGQSGVKRIEWWTDSNLLGGTIWGTSGQVEVPYIGERTLYFSAEDNRGNVEETGSVSFRVNDVVPPVVTFGGSADDRYSDTAYIYVIADDGWYGGTLHEVEYSHDGILWQSVTQDPDGMSDTRWMVQVTGTGLGVGTLYARATDTAGNASGSEAYAYEIFDGIEPECDLEAPSGVRQGEQVRLVATDPGSSPSGVKRIHWTYNGGAPQSFEGTSALVTVTEYGAANDFEIWAEDNAGNTGPIAYKSPWVADGIGPAVDLTVNAGGTRADFSAFDPQPGHEGMLLLRWTIDDDPGVNQVAVSNGGAAWQDFSVEGNHTIRVWAMDPAGNEGATETATFWCQGDGGDGDPGGGDPPVGGFQIAGGRAWSNSRELAITSNVDGAVQMRFKGPGDAEWRPWVAYSAETIVDIDASQPDGDWTILAQYRNGTDDTADVTDAQASIGIDRVSPSTGSNANELRDFTSPEPIILVPDDDRSGIAEVWYRIDDEAPIKDETEIIFAPGTYRLRWWSVDHAGNVEAIHDRTGLVMLGDEEPGGDPPVGGFSIAGGRQWTNTSNLPIASTVSNAVQMRFKAPGDPAWRAWTAYSPTHVLAVNGQSDGGWTILAQYRNGTDEAADVTGAQASIGVDRLAPTTGSNANEARAFTRGEQIILVPADDRSGVAEVWYRIDDGAPVLNQTVITPAPGTFRLRWWSVDHAGNTEAVNDRAVTVLRDATILAVTSPNATISFGGTYRLTGRLDSAGTGVPNQPVRVQRLEAGTWVDDPALAYTGADGVFSVALKPSSRKTYRARFVGSADHDSADSPSVVVTPKASIGTPVAPKTMYRGKATTVYGSLKPSHTVGTYPVRIYKYLYVSGKWKSYGYVKARASSYFGYTRYKASVKLPYKGKWKLQAVHPADAGHPLVKSGWRSVTVK